MACQNVCKLCRNLVISTAIAYDATTNTLNITIPDNGYRSCDKVCIVIAQTIPAETTINAQVFIFVGASSFPLLSCDCVPVLACEIKSRTKYSTKVVTNTTTGAFRLLSRICCQRPDNLIALPVVSPAPAALRVKTTTTIKKEVVSNE